jgi:alpha-ribazole phosphatase CobZ
MEDIKLFEDEEKEVKIVNHDIFKKPTKTFVITFKKKRKIISTLEGFKEVNIVGNNYVPKDLWEMRYSDWQNYKKEIIKSLGYKEKEASLLYTGVDIENFGLCEEKFGDYKIVCYATAGVKSNALRIGFDKGRFYEKEGDFFEIGTINIIILTDTFLTEGALINSIIQITEAKTSLLQDLDIRSSYKPFENQATGTGTDNIIFVNGENGKITYTGGHSKFGEIIGKVVYKAVKEGIKKQNNIFAGRDIIDRLKERGITKEEIVKTAVEMYIYDGKFGDKNKFKKVFEEEFDKILKDVNISSLIIAGLKLEEEAQKGNIPNLKYYKDDPVYLISDEILGMQISQYIGGTLAIFEFERIDRKKPGILKKLPPFIDDIIGGIISGITTRMFSK